LSTVWPNEKYVLNIHKEKKGIFKQHNKICIENILFRKIKIVNKSETRSRDNFDCRRCKQKKNKHKKKIIKKVR